MKIVTFAGKFKLGDKVTFIGIRHIEPEEVVGEITAFSFPDDRQLVSIKDTQGGFWTVPESTLTL